MLKTLLIGALGGGLLARSLLDRPVRVELPSHAGLKNHQVKHEDHDKSQPGPQTTCQQ
jgi:hypothetical protein